MPETSPNKLQLYLKIGLIVISAVVTVSCLVGSIAYDWMASSQSQKIVSFQIQNPTLSDSKLAAATELMKQTQETAHQHGVTLFELFTHVLTGFLGIAIAALSDVVGMKVDAEHLVQTAPVEGEPVK